MFLPVGSTGYLLFHGAGQRPPEAVTNQARLKVKSSDRQDWPELPEWNLRLARSPDTGRVEVRLSSCFRLPGRAGRAGWRSGCGPRSE